jgi:hypothetical protein
LMDLFTDPDPSKRVLLAGTYNGHPVPTAAAPLFACTSWITYLWTGTTWRRTMISPRILECARS